MYHVPCTVYHHSPPCHQSQVQVDLSRPCAPLIDSVYAGLIRLDGHIVVTSGFSSVAICIRKNICFMFFSITLLLVLIMVVMTGTSIMQ